MRLNRSFNPPSPRPFPGGRGGLALTLCAAMFAPSVLAAQPPANVRPLGSLRPAAARRAAAEKALTLLQASAQTYTQQRQCFSCHHQALPALAVAAARKTGWSADTDLARAQSHFTLRYFGELRDKIAEGQGVVGGPYTAGYALTGLAADEFPADATTDALVNYLLQRQQPDGSWRIQTHRPPLEDSDFTATALAARGLAAYARGEAKPSAAAGIVRAAEWLLAAEPASHEDRVFQLLGMHWCGQARIPDVRFLFLNWPVAGCALFPAELAAARAAGVLTPEPAAWRAALQQNTERLLERQQADGGWGQLPQAQSDAYATGQALVALRLAGGLAVDHPAMVRGANWLLTAQLADGSWRVPSRSKPFQDYFESGYPHDEAQFISISAASWAVTALAEAAVEGE